MKKDLLITFITEFFVLISGIIVYKIAAILFGKEGFSEYTLTRRAISFIQPLILMGLGVGMPRYIAYSLGNSKKSEIFFSGGIFILFFIGLIITLIFNIFTNQISFLIFGNIKYSNFLLPINVMIWGIISHSLCYSYFRGKLLFLKANILQFLNLGLAMPFSFLFGSNTKEVIFFTGIIWILTSIFSFLIFIKKIHFDNNQIISSIKELILYGSQRVPGDFFLAGLLALPAFITAHTTGVKEAGFVAFGISILQLIGASYTPLGLILLPKASQFIANNEFPLLKIYIYKILKIILPITILGIILFEIFADQLITIYLGRNFNEVITISRIIIIGGLGYSLYVTLRSIIDAYYVKAVNTKNIIFSLILFLLFFILGNIFIHNYNYLWIIGFFMISLYFLGILTILEIRKILLKLKNKN